MLRGFFTKSPKLIFTRKVYQHIHFAVPYSKFGNKKNRKSGTLVQTKSCNQENVQKEKKRGPTNAKIEQIQNPKIIKINI